MDGAALLSFLSTQLDGLSAERASRILAVKSQAVIADPEIKRIEALIDQNETIRARVEQGMAEE